jgi:hypothetical protein
MGGELLRINTSTTRSFRSGSSWLPVLWKTFAFQVRSPARFPSSWKVGITTFLRSSPSLVLPKWLKRKSRTESESISALSPASVSRERRRESPSLFMARSSPQKSRIRGKAASGFSSRAKKAALTAPAEVPTNKSTWFNNVGRAGREVSIRRSARSRPAAT